MSYTEYIAQIFSVHLARFLHIYIYTHIGIFLDLQNVPCPFLINNSSKVTTRFTSIITDSVS